MRSHTMHGFSEAGRRAEFSRPASFEIHTRQWKQDIEATMRNIRSEIEERDKRIQAFYERETEQGDHTIMPPSRTRLDSFSIGRELRERRGVCETSRSLEQVANEYGLTKQELLNIVDEKDVVDLGAGNSSFASELMENDQKPRSMTVVDLNQINSTREGITLIKGNIGLTLGMIPVESFDHAFATYSLPLWASDRYEVERFLQESLAILKTHGVLHISPSSDFLGKRPSFSRKESTASVQERYGQSASQLGSLPANLGVKERNQIFIYQILDNEKRFIEILSYLERFGIVSIEPKLNKHGQIESLNITKQQDANWLFWALEEYPSLEDTKTGANGHL